jgi:hypothetical protein
VDFLDEEGLRLVSRRLGSHRVVHLQVCWIHCVAKKVPMLILNIGGFPPQGFQPPPSGRGFQGR